jgi:hypothetical protein
MKKTLIIEIISCLFILLFTYAALTKLTDYEKFVVQIGQSPLLTAFAGWIAWMVPLLEILVSAMLAVPRWRLIGLYAAFSLMVMFTTYIVCILTLSVYVPCSCGGVLEKLGWTEHLVFNIAFALLSMLGVLLYYTESNGRDVQRDNEAKPTFYKMKAIKKPVVALFSYMILSTTLVVVLYALSDHSIRKHNSLLRIILKHPIHNIGGVDLKFNSYYIAGASDDRIYLGNYTGPLHLLIANYTLADTQHVVLSIRNMGAKKFKAPKLAVAPPYFYIMDGEMPSLYRGDVNKWLADSFMFDKSAYFLDALPVGPSSFAIRTTSSLTDELALGKISPEKPYIKVDTTLLQKQIDGKFCTDGMLLYDQESPKVVYLYSYRNQYIVSDTSLNLLYRGNTIDTVSRAQVTAAKISSDKTYTMSSPPLLVNAASCVSSGLLFVNSPLLSRNESEEAFKKNSAVDVYDLNDGTYKFSFYIPRFNGRGLEEFRIFNNKLIVRYSQRVETYKLDPDYFPDKGSPDNR